MRSKLRASQAYKKKFNRRAKIFGIKNFKGDIKNYLDTKRLNSLYNRKYKKRKLWY